MGSTSSSFLHLAGNRRYRLYTSAVIALLVLLVSRAGSSGVVSFMITWIAFSASLLISSWVIILSFHPEEVKAIADKEDSSGAFIFIFIVMAAFISLFAIIILLQSVPTESKRGLSLHMILAVTSVCCSWLLIHTLFILRYAHLYYMPDNKRNDNNTTNSGLDFPNEKEPDYLDFAYFSFVLGMTFQVSDVVITSKHIRRLALLHGLISFVYNTVIVALSINILSGIIAK
jgi:uncharacterized membrane protein